MTASAEEARSFIGRLFALADRVASRNGVVAALHCDWSSFGSWMLQVQKGDAADDYRKAQLGQNWDAHGPDVLRVSWDGRDSLLTIETAPTEPLSSPGPWKQHSDTVIDRPDSAIREAEENILRWLDKAK